MSSPEKPQRNLEQKFTATIHLMLIQACYKSGMYATDKGTADMPYLQRLHSRPTMAELTHDEQEFLQNHVDSYGAELVIDGQVIRWEHLDKVKVVVAPRIAGPAGWLVKRLFSQNKTRYHVGVYFGSQEAVLPNVTWDVARYVLESIAYYAAQPIVYEGPEDLVPITEV